MQAVEKIELKISPYKMISNDDIEYIQQYGKLAEKLVRNRIEVKFNSNYSRFTHISIQREMREWINENINGFFSIKVDNSEVVNSFIIQFEKQEDMVATKINFDGNTIKI